MQNIPGTRGIFKLLDGQLVIHFLDERRKVNYSDKRKWINDELSSPSEGACFGTSSLTVQTKVWCKREKVCILGTVV